MDIAESYYTMGTLSNTATLAVRNTYLTKKDIGDTDIDILDHTRTRRRAREDVSVSMMRAEAKALLASTGRELKGLAVIRARYGAEYDPDKRPWSDRFAIAHDMHRQAPYDFYHLFYANHLVTMTDELAGAFKAAKTYTAFRSRMEAINWPARISRPDFSVGADSKMAKTISSWGMHHTLCLAVLIAGPASIKDKTSRAGRLFTLFAQTFRWVQRVGRPMSLVELPAIQQRGLDLVSASRKLLGDAFQKPNGAGVHDFILRYLPMTLNGTLATSQGLEAFHKFFAAAIARGGHNHGDLALSAAKTRYATNHMLDGGYWMRRAMGSRPAVRLRLGAAFRNMKHPTVARLPHPLCVGTYRADTHVAEPDVPPWGCVLLDLLNLGDDAAVEPPDREPSWRVHRYRTTKQRVSRSDRRRQPDMVDLTDHNHPITRALRRQAKAEAAFDPRLSQLLSTPGVTCTRVASMRRPGRAGGQRLEACLTPGDHVWGWYWEDDLTFSRTYARLDDIVEVRGSGPTGDDRSLVSWVGRWFQKSDRIDDELGCPLLTGCANPQPEDFAQPMRLMRDQIMIQHVCTDGCRAIKRCALHAPGSDGADPDGDPLGHRGCRDCKQQRALTFHKYTPLNGDSNSDDDHDADSLDHFRVFGREEGFYPELSQASRALCRLAAAK
jgi:hypothetical protein